MCRIFEVADEGDVASGLSCQGGGDFAQAVQVVHVTSERRSSRGGNVWMRCAKPLRQTALALPVLHAIGMKSQHSGRERVFVSERSLDERPTFGGP